MMRSIFTQRLLQSLLLAASCMSVSYAHSRKTFLMPRPVGMNKAMEFSPWDSRLYDVSQDNKCIHSRVQVTPFYQHSTNRSEIGEYFGIGNCKNSFTVGQRYDFAQDRPLSSPLLPTPAEVEGALLSGSTERDLVGSSFAGTVHWRPDQEVWGARFDLEYFKNPQNGFFFKMVLPVASVSNSMNMCIENDKKIKIELARSHGSVAASDAQEFTLTDFFAGKVKITKDRGNLRDPLTKSKITGRHTQGGLADLDVILGYRHNCEGNKHVAGNIRVTVPTGNRVEGCYLFEPVLGNGHHMGLGFGLDAGWQVWCNKNARVWVEGGVQFTYLFEEDEVRLLGVKGFTENPALAHYLLMGRVQGPGAAQAFFPAANELTRAVDVTPGSHIDALLDVSFQMKSFVFDLGYNLYWRAREKVCVKSWEDNTFGIFAKTVFTDNDVAVKDFLDSKFLNRENLDTCAAETPDQMSHKLYLGATYRCCSLCFPASFGIGGSYEFASNNAALSQYALWLKAGISW